MSYGPDRADQNRLAATYVDKILRGAKPADLPVQQPTHFKFRLLVRVQIPEETSDCAARNRGDVVA
jgi:ABC-type uncharacterized transport system substrate-binding protein